MATATATDFSSIPDNKGCSGYDYEFIDGEPRDQLKCSICHLVLRDPHQVTCCSNRFCKSCLDQLQGKNCPLCREPINDNYFRDGGINREIISLKVYCTNSEEGCEWQGTINETDTSIDTHLNSCPYQLVPCTNGCGEKIRKSSLKTHLTNNCPKRIVNCQICKRKGTHQLITSRSHLDECPDLPIQCSNEGCNEKMLRRSLASHNETCPKAIIPCEYNTVGCDERMKREEQEKHNEESTKVHLQMTKKQLQVTTETLKAALEKKHPLIASNEVFKLSQFAEKKESNGIWQSPGFYTLQGGYKMELHVCPNGYKEAKGTHVSCSIGLMAGEYDDTLEWPFQGEVTIELLNQLEDRNHKKVVLSYYEATPHEFKERVQKDISSKLRDIPDFISQSELGYHQGRKAAIQTSHRYLSSMSHDRSLYNCQYLKNDCLYFRVSVNHRSTTKLWLVKKD